MNWKNSSVIPFSDVTGILLIIVQGYYLQWFYGQFMNTKFAGYKKSRYIIMVIWIVMRFIMSHVWVTGYDTIALQEKWFVTITLLLIATFWLYEADRKQKIFLAVTFFAINEISFLLGHMVMELGQVIFPFWSWCLTEGYISSVDVFMNLSQVSVIALQLLFFLVFVLLIRFGLKDIDQIYREKEFGIHRTELFFILTPGLAGILICNLLRILMITIENKIPLTLYERYPGMLLLVPAILVLSFLSIRFGIKVYQDMISLNREKSSRIILERQMGNIQEHVGEMERVYANMRSVRHDMKNQLAVLARLVDQKMKKEDDEIREYLAEMELTVRGLDFHFQTGSAIADTILSMKYHEAVRQMPELTMDIEQLIFPQNLRIQNYGLTVILCNAIDNAVEACVRCKCLQEHPWIKISSMERGKMFILEVRNCFDGQLRLKNKREFPQTVKQDRG